MFTPAGVGPQESEQQKLSHPVPVQTVPAGAHPLPVAGAAHCPSVAPEGLLQFPLQHSRSEEHASVTCAQNDGVEQKPLLQYFPQHWSLPVQGLPELLQVVESGLQVPDAHVPPQHSSFLVQAALSAVHCCGEHCLLMHAEVQHSVPALHAAPDGRHMVLSNEQVFVAESQRDEQQSPSAAHAAPEAPHPPSPLEPLEPLLEPPLEEAPPSSPSGIASLELPQPMTTAAATVPTPTNETRTAESRCVMMAVPPA
jgi:hypothetical protein